MTKQSIIDALEAAVGLGRSAPLPGSGRTFQRWQMLSSLAAGDLTLARVSEAHLDAMAILAELEESAPEPVHPVLAERLGVQSTSTWGVFAAEAPGFRLDGVETSTGWLLTGTKAWCSLAGDLSHALITAHTDDGRRLFAVSLTDGGVFVEPNAWISRGLSDVSSGPITLDAVPGIPIGEHQWYLQRPGFAWGGLGVAACWYGGAAGVATSYWARLGLRKPDQIALMHLGAIDTALNGVRAALRDAARRIDDGRASGAAGSILALRVRTLTANAADETLRRVGHSTGPGPLALDEDHARRVADLTVYLRQHHAQRDEAALGSMLVDDDRAEADQGFVL